MTRVPNLIEKKAFYILSRPQVWDKVSNVILVEEPCFEKAYKLKSIGLYCQKVLDSKKRES